MRPKDGDDGSGARGKGGRRGHPAERSYRLDDVVLRRGGEPVEHAVRALAAWTDTRRALDALRDRASLLRSTGDMAEAAGLLAVLRHILPRPNTVGFRLVAHAARIPEMTLEDLVEQRIGVLDVSPHAMVLLGREAGIPLDTYLALVAATAREQEPPEGSESIDAALEELRSVWLEEDEIDREFGSP